MSNRHQEILAAYQDVSSVYSYGYGALRECCRSFDEDGGGAEAFHGRWKAIVAAVEFRAAEIGAVVLAENIKISNRVEKAGRFSPQEQTIMDIYESDNQEPGLRE